MSNDALSSAQFNGVLHAVKDDSRMSAPYEVSSRDEILTLARRLQDHGWRMVEHSHEGSCADQPNGGCKFSQGR